MKTLGICADLGTVTYENDLKEYIQKKNVFLQINRWCLDHKRIKKEIGGTLNVRHYSTLCICFLFYFITRYQASWSNLSGNNVILQHSAGGFL
jgi:hypothetical protein